MILRGIRFGPVHQASGATNFFGHGLGRGHGWWYHKLLYPFGLNFAGSTVVTKTTTLLARKGNMPLKADGVTPKEWIPRCIIVNRKEQVVLNAVSLSGPGIESLITSGEWQRKTEPFFISVMSLAPTPEGRRAELEGLLERLAAAKKHERFRADFGVQINFSCPNGGIDPNALLDEVVPALEVADKTLPNTVPVMPKFGPEAYPESVWKIAQHPRCDAICVFNTLPYGKHPRWASMTPPVDWKELFGSAEVSPLEKRFPGFKGGLSGAPLRQFLFEWLDKARHRYGITKPICAGGGILSPETALEVLKVGADAVFLGSIAMLAPTRVRQTIRAVHRYAGQRHDFFPERTRDQLSFGGHSV